MITKKGKHGKYFLFTLVFTCLVLLTLFIYRKFQLKTLIIINTSVNLHGLSVFNRKNLLFLDTQKTVEYLQKQNPAVKSVNITQSFPDTIFLKVERRIPVAKIISKTEDLYIDNEGIILKEESFGVGLPVIETADISITAAQKADWRLIKAVSFIEETKKQGIIIVQIKIDDAAGVLTATSASGMEIILPFNADTSIEASSLQVIILRFTIVGKNITKVDFRFDKPLVTLANGEKISSTF